MLGPVLSPQVVFPLQLELNDFKIKQVPFKLTTDFSKLISKMSIKRKKETKHVLFIKALTIYPSFSSLKNKEY